MREVQGDIWDYHKQGHWIVITTNGFVKKNGECVMGRGVAAQAKSRFPDLPSLLGTWIKESGNQTALFGGYRIATFPVKHNWWEKASLSLVEASCVRLVNLVDLAHLEPPIYLVRPGCGNGQLDWQDVKPILEKYLDDRFIICQK